MQQVLKILGKNIKQQRELKKLSQAALGHAAGGIPQASISHYEAGTVALQVDILCRIADALDVNPQSLLTDGLKHIEKSSPTPLEALAVVLKSLDAGEIDLAQLVFPGIPPALARSLQKIQNVLEWKAIDSAVQFARENTLAASLKRETSHKDAEPEKAQSSRSNPRRK